MKRLKPDAETLSILQRTIPAVHTDREEKLVGGFLEVASESALLELNINAASGCACTTNKSCSTVTPSTTTTTTTTKEPKSLSFVMEALF